MNNLGLISGTECAFSGRRTLHGPFLALVAVVGLAAAAHASPVAALQAQGAITYWTFSDGQVLGSFENSNTTPLAQVGASGTFDGGVGPYTGSYFAEASFGAARYSVYGTGVASNRGSSQAFVSVNDYFTVFGAPAGSTLRVVGSIHGSGNDHGDASSAYVAAMAMLLTADLTGGCPNTGGRLNGTVDLDCTSSVAIDNGTPYHFLIQLQGYVESNGPLQFLDFSSTASVQSVGVYDSLGRYVPDAIIQTASGAIYGSTVPEPATFLLVGAALLAAAGVLRRRRGAVDS